MYSSMSITKDSEYFIMFGRDGPMWAKNTISASHCFEVLILPYLIHRNVNTFDLRVFFRIWYSQNIAGKVALFVSGRLETTFYICKTKKSKSKV